MRIDVMSVMRGVDPFEQLWERRTTFEENKGELFEVMSLPDLVKAKKTQREKDWPMIRRLLEADYLEQTNPSQDKIRFWLMESRTPDMLVQLARQYPEDAANISSVRPLLQHAIAGNAQAIEAKLTEEQKIEMDRDRSYWLPLRAELETLRLVGTSSEEEV